MSATIEYVVSETTYSIVADILRSDIQLVSVGKRRLEGHDRQEEVYVVQNPEVELEAGGGGGGVEAGGSLKAGVDPPRAPGARGPGGGGAAHPRGGPPREESRFPPGGA